MFLDGLRIFSLADLCPNLLKGSYIVDVAQSDHPRPRATGATVTRSSRQESSQEIFPEIDSQNMSLASLVLP